jgi:6-pyruvoyltetrahydropterin/6-carboxytetrahydropterin synthase
VDGRLVRTLLRPAKPPAEECRGGRIAMGASVLADRYHVRLTKDYLVFSAGHFITFGGNICERLHGHNYRVTAEVHGPLDENHYVVDFIALRDTLKAIVDELDHHMLLPTQHPTIRVVATEREVEATFEDRRWVFPRGDCILLDIPNTTSELLARHIATTLAADLQARTGGRPEHVRVEVDECFGNVAVCDLDTKK